MNDIEMETLFEMMGTRLKRADYSGNRSAQCPLAPWTHTKGRDKAPSLTAKAGTPALYKCWACHSEGSISKLAKEYSDLSGDFQPIEYVRTLARSTAWGKQVEPGIKYKRVGKRIQNKLDKEITEEKLSKYMELVPQYAFDRGITKDQILKWEIGFDKAENRMIFTVRDYCGKLMGVSGRDVTGKRKPKYKHYPGLQKEKVLYGEKFIDRMNTRAYMVEGFLDVLAMERNGVKNVFASMGTSLSDDQIKKLGRWFKEVIIVPDVDDKGAGLQYAETYGEKLVMAGMKVGIAGVRPNEKYQQRERPRQWEAIDYKMEALQVLKDKDPADLSKEDLKTVLENVVWIKLRASSERGIFD